MGIVPTAESDRHRFWAKVDKTPDCWLWTASRFERGYGVFRLRGKLRKAHVVSYEWNVGPTNGLQVCHRCDVRHCIRPDHLFLGTQKDNIQDAVSKGRMASGLRSGMHTQNLTKLTDDDIREIRALYAQGDWTQYELAIVFEVNQTMISKILLRKRWSHVT